MKPISHCIRISLLIPPLLLLTACISHQQYRVDYHSCISPAPQQNCKVSSIQEYSNPEEADREYLLGFIEFDDQGQLWDRNQMHSLLDKLAGDETGDDLLMVVFVHGWKHSAEAGDGNIDSFRRTLMNLSELESSISRYSGAEPRKIVGIYLGWRGGSVSLPLLKELTFWDRKNTAHKVGYGGVTEVLSRLELLQKSKGELARQDGRESNTRLIVVGHSFGAAVVYSAVSEILENGFVQTHGPTGVVSDSVGFADLVVLINPAFEAMRYSSLSDMATERGTYFRGQLPVLAVLTSETDNATKFAFPIGRRFSTLFQKEREVQRYNPVKKNEESIDQGKANVTAIGHFNDYVTHYLRADDSKENGKQNIFNLESEISLFLAAGEGWENDHPGSKISFIGSTLERTTASAGRNPYLNILVDRELIRDHNDISDPRIESFVRQLILISSQSLKLENRKLLRSKAMSR